MYVKHYKCKLCGKFYQTKNMLGNHIQAGHQNFRIIISLQQNFPEQVKFAVNIFKATIKTKFKIFANEMISYENHDPSIVCECYVIKPSMLSLKNT